MQKEVMHVKIYNDVCIILTKAKNGGAYLGKTFAALLWVTNIYKSDDNEWRCVMTQEFPVNC